MTNERADTIRGLLAQGLSRRTIAARLGVSARQLGRILGADAAPAAPAEAAPAKSAFTSVAADHFALTNTAPSSPSAPADAAPPAAEFPDYIPPGPGRVLPTPTFEQALYEGGVSHPGKAWIRCVACPCPAFRDKSGVDSWSCTCRAHHAPTQVVVNGMVQFEWRPFTMARSARPLTLIG